MSDRQPLLNTSNKASFDINDSGNDQQPSIKKYDRNNNQCQEKNKMNLLFFIVCFVGVNGFVRKKKMMKYILTRIH